MLSVDDLKDAARLRYVALRDPEKVEYVCRAALLLRSLEYVDGKCPGCGYTKEQKGHLWQCDIAQALDMIEGMIR
jgi:hypothetical protein